MILRTLASGSSGNCVLIQSGATALLVDAGVSCRKITQRLKACGLQPEDLTGILITHEHTDHVAGLNVLLKRREIPIYATAGTCQIVAQKCPVAAAHLMMIPSSSYFELGELTVTAFPTPHDASDSVGYLLSDGERSVAIATDLGEINDYIREIVADADLVLLEANHDIPMLRTGPYPYLLQERILGVMGHLCNEAAAEFAVYLAQNKTKSFVLAHLSKENNTPELAYAVVADALKQANLLERVNVAVAPRDELSQTFVV